MKLTSFTDYSLRVLIYSACRPGQRGTIAQIAAAYDVSENHLVKVVHFLGKQGWLRNVRGKGGGLELGLPANAIRLDQVVRQTEGQSVLAECFAEGAHACCIAPDCRLRSALAQAEEAFYAVLGRYTLADLATNAPQLAKVLFVVPGRESVESRMRA